MNAASVCTEALSLTCRNVHSSNTAPSPNASVMSTSTNSTCENVCPDRSRAYQSSPRTVLVVRGAVSPLAAFGHAVDHGCTHAGTSLRSAGRAGLLEQAQRGADPGVALRVAVDAERRVHPVDVVLYRLLGDAQPVADARRWTVRPPAAAAPRTGGPSGGPRRTRPAASCGRAARGPAPSHRRRRPARRRRAPPRSSRSSWTGSTSPRRRPAGRSRSRSIASCAESSRMPSLGHAAAQRDAEGDAVAVGQVDVEDHDVDEAGRIIRAASVAVPTATTTSRPSVDGERVLEHRAEQRLVLDDGDADRFGAGSAHRHQYRRRTGPPHVRARGRGDRMAPAGRAADESKERAMTTTSTDSAAAVAARRDGLRSDRITLLRGTAGSRSATASGRRCRPTYVYSIYVTELDRRARLVPDRGERRRRRRRSSARSRSSRRTGPARSRGWPAPSSCASVVAASARFGAQLAVRHLRRARRLGARRGAVQRVPHGRRSRV